MALRQLSTTEQRLRAVLAVEAGGRVGEVAFAFGVSRQSLHAWLVRYREGGLEELADRSHRPDTCPHQASPEVEAAVCEMRRDHPRWGPVRIEFELGRDGCPGPVPSKATVYRILVRHGLAAGRKRRRRREDYRRWQRDEPMELWQMDIVGGLMLASGKEVKVVTGVDDHSRFCVIAAVVPRATGRAVCLAFAGALQRFGTPQEVLTDNGKQFTDRFGKGAEVLFDRICRTNGIIHRLTQPATPTTTGKVERFHQTLEREMVDDAGVFADLQAAQAAVDAFREEYNTRRPHQSLGMAFPADRFQPELVVERREREQELIPLRLPGFLADTLPQPPPRTVPVVPAQPAGPVPPRVSGTAVQQAARAVAATPEASRAQLGPVEFDRVIPPSGNLEVLGKQFWLGPVRSGQVVRFWADTQIIYLTVGGARVKTVRSHLTNTDLAVLTRLGGHPAGAPPEPRTEPARRRPAGPIPPIEIDRAVSTAGYMSVGNHRINAPELLAGTRIGIRLDETTLTLFDLDTRELIRVAPNPLATAEIGKLRGARPAGPPPQPRTDPIRVQRLASNSGGISVCRQKVALGRTHARKTVTVLVGHDMLTIELDDGIRIIPRTTTDPVFQIKAQRPRKVTHI